MIIGITGGTGCGKTTLLEEIRKLGGTVLDCDAIYHQLLKTDNAMLSAIDARFPGVVEEGILNRKKLGAIVFSDEQALLDLNKITHLYNGICRCADMHLHGNGNCCYSTHANRGHVHSILFKRNRNAIHEKRHIQSYLSSI